MRGLWASRNGVELVKTGKKYIFRCKIRANEPMDSLVAGNADASWDKTTITTDWQDLETIFDSTKGFNIYARGNSGDWFEIKDQVLIEAGGVATPNLMTFTDQTLSINKSFPQWSGMAVTQTLSPGHYCISYRYDINGDRSTITRVRITTDDTRRDASEQWGGHNLYGKDVYYEFDVPNDNYNYKAWILTTGYGANATLPMTYSDGYVGKLSDQVGGVTKPLDIGSPTVWTGVSLVDAIQLAKYSASGAHDQQEVLTYHLGQKLEPSTKYRISFVARGSGDLNMYLFPGVAPSQDGRRSDGRIITSLTGDFRDYSYEVTTYANFSGDTDKRLLFRFPADSKAGWVDIYIGSVRVEKVGGVAKAPSQPQAAGLLYTGSFTVSTGSTPAWGYKAIPVGDMDGDTLTVTLTPHQTAGAKLDQICVALYDSKITKPLATYAYPATEQTNTITIVDKLPDENAKLLFYSNDKTINSNTTIEFSDVTIVGS